MATFDSLPAEIRLCIYEQVFPTHTIKALKPLGFRNPNLEYEQTNVSITLPTSALMQLYRSNPAGESKGRFWRPTHLLAVNRQIRGEAGYLWDSLPIEVGTWMSFLSRRPEALLEPIQHVYFAYWLNPRWSPAHPPTHPMYALDNWVHTICSLWGEQLERLYCIMGANLQKMSIDMTLVHPPRFTYRVKNGLRRDSLTSLREKMPVTLEKALLEFRADGKWPDTQVIVSDDEDTDEEQFREQAVLPQVAAVG